MAGVHRSKKSKASKLLDDPKQQTNKNNDDDGSRKAPPVEEDTLKEQLDRALVAIISNQEQTTRIQTSWRTHLHLLSMIVLLILITQLQEPASSCMKEIKVWNEMMLLRKGDDEHVIGFFRAVGYAASDSMMEIMSIMCGLSIVWLLNQPAGKNDFSTLHFRVSCFFIPFIVLAYYHNRSLGCLDQVDGPLSPKALDEKDPAEDQIDDRQRRTFPVVLLFHLIMSLSLFFMQSQRKQLESSVEKIQQLKKDLLEAKKKK